MIFRDKTSLEEVGQVVFRDTAKTDLNGNVKETSSVVLNDNVALGNLALTGGKVSVDVSTIANAIGSGTGVASAFDFTGTYAFKRFDGTLPTGYVTVTPEADCTANPDDCMIPENAQITLVRYSGKSFTKTPGSSNCDIGQNSVTCTTSDGTVGADDLHALSLWDGPASGSESGLQSCGYKTGFTADEARAGGAVHIAALPVVGSQITFGDYTWTAPSPWGTGATPYSLPWMKNGATASRAVPDCSVVSKVVGNATYKLQACKGMIGSDVRYNAHDSDVGGCVDSNNKPVFVDWTTINNANPTCTPGTHPVAGIASNSCVYSNVVPRPGAAATNFTCTYAGGLFSDITLNTAVAPTNTPFVHDTLIAQGGSCAVASPNSSQLLAAYKCFANVYFQDRPRGSCMRDYDFNWSATTAQSFVVAGKGDKPRANFLTDIVQYSADGNTFFLNSTEREMGQVREGNRTVFCDVDRFTRISGKKISDSRLLFDLTQGGRLVNIDNPACRAAATSTDDSVQNDIRHMVRGEKFLFYLDKQ